MIRFILLVFVLTLAACSDPAPVAPPPAGKANCALCGFLGDDRYTIADESSDSSSETEADSTQADTETEAEVDNTPLEDTLFEDANLERMVRQALVAQNLAHLMQSPTLESEVRLVLEGRRSEVLLQVTDSSLEFLMTRPDLEHWKFLLPVADFLQTLQQDQRESVVRQALEGQNLAVLLNVVDANLERMIQQALDRRLTPKDISFLLKLVAKNKNIRSLVGLEHSSLLVLSLSKNQIADVGPLANLTNLRQLHLNDNQIADVGPLANLTNLESLHLGKNQIADVGPLANLTRLTMLRLESNQVADVGPLAKLTNLEWLELSRNQIIDVTLANLTNLESLWLDNNQITHVALEGLTSLQELWLNDNQIADVELLANLTNLQLLWLGQNQIADVSSLTNLTNLPWLELHDNQIADVSPLAKLTNLQKLWLSNNQIADVSPLANLTNLQKLWLSSNQIADVGPLAKLTNLQELVLWYNPLSAQAINEQIPALRAKGIYVQAPPT